MIIYKPCGNAKPHPMRNEVMQIYLKYKDYIDMYKEFIKYNSDLVPDILEIKCKINLFLLCLFVHLVHLFLNMQLYLVNLAYYLLTVVHFLQL